MDKKEDEGNFEYIDRILAALMAVHEIQGVVLAIKTRAGTTMITAKGNPPRLKLIDDEREWEEYWGR